MLKKIKQIGWALKEVLITYSTVLFWVFGISFVLIGIPFIIMSICNYFGLNILAMAGLVILYYLILWPTARLTMDDNNPYKEKE